MFKWLTNFQNEKSHFEILNQKIQEIYSLLSIADSSQTIIVEFDDNLKQEKMVVRINGRLWTKTDNPMSELREFHNILALNIKENRIITVSLE